MGKPPNKRIENKKLSATPDFEMSSFGISHEDHPGFKAAMAARAEASVAELPEIIELLKQRFRSHDPLDILATFAAYGLTTFVTKNGVEDRKALKEILPHHAELLQALLLTIPPDEWGHHPVTPDVMQTVFDAAPKMGHAFFFQRIIEGRPVTDPQKMAVLSLQQRIRMHTNGIRNWGYMGDVQQITLDLYGPLDAQFSAYHGFTCTDLISTMAAVLGELERRYSEHTNVLAKVLKGKKPQEVFDLYYKHVPGLIGSSKNLGDGLPGINLESAKAVVMSHFDLRHQTNATFTPQDVSVISGRSEQICASMLKAISLLPGALNGTKEEYLYLGNPVWHAPVIDLGGEFFIPVPQAFFSHIHRILERLATEVG